MKAAALAFALSCGLASPLEPQRSNPMPIGDERVDRDHGLASSYAPTDLVTITGGYEKGRTYELRREAAAAWERMRTSAHTQGVELEIVSSYRSFAHQRDLYDAKVKEAGQKQDTVAAPGHSEHQLGTAVDICSKDPATVLQESFGKTPAGLWLLAHAPEFGFAVSYTTANRANTGYAPEPWHYRYFGARAAELHAKNLGKS